MAEWKPTCELRWVNRADWLGDVFSQKINVLQQKWVTELHYPETGKFVDKEEWRDVEIVEET